MLGDSASGSHFGSLYAGIVLDLGSVLRWTRLLLASSHADSILRPQNHVPPARAIHGRERHSRPPRQGVRPDIRRDPRRDARAGSPSRAGGEVFGSHGTLMIGGEVKTRAKVDFERIARKVYREIGYREKLEVIVRVAQQSPDIAMGVDGGGAGDQGIMYGYATDE